MTLTRVTPYLDPTVTMNAARPLVQKPLTLPITLPSSGMVTNSVNFGASIRSQDPINDIKQVLSQYTYGVDIDTLLSSNRKFRAMYSPKTVELWNYYKLNPKFAPCNELVEDALKQLHNRYKNDYIFASVRGSEPTFFHPRAVPGITQPGHHYYLLGWRIEDNTDVENALRKNSKTIPPQTLVIDPTFQKVMRASEASGYTMATKPDTTLYLRTQPSTDLRLPFSTNERRSTSYLPLGTLQRLVPELGNREPEQMLYWYFQQKQNPAEPPIMRLARQSPHGEIRDWPNWKDDIAAVSPNNALLLLAAKIEADFEEPDTLAQKGQRLLRGIIKALT